MNAESGNTTRNLNDEEGLKFLAACAPDLLVSAFFNQRVHAPALALPKLGCLNIHPALLPEAKGVDPVFQSLLHGVPPLGVTVHCMTPELDAGRIVAQRSSEARARGARALERVRNHRTAVSRRRRTSGDRDRICRRRALTCGALLFPAQVCLANGTDRSPLF